MNENNIGGEFKKYNIDKLENSLKSVVNNFIIDTEVIEQMTKPLYSVIERISEMSKSMINIFVSTQIKYTPFFESLGKTLQKAKENPDSVFNWMDYARNLSEYIWTIPYGMNSKQLKEIFENVNSEAEFDAYMRKYYNKNTVKNMLNDIERILSLKHKMIFNQIKKAYDNKMYALSIVGMMSIIDELCVYFIKDKGKSARRGMFIPIIDDMEEKDGINYYLINLMILSDNINTIYENIDFNKKILINSKKKARRNPCQHGRSYSNRKTDAIMLFNTIYNLLIFQKIAKKYKDSLIYRNKVFYLENDNVNSRRNND